MKKIIIFILLFSSTVVTKVIHAQDFDESKLLEELGIEDTVEQKVEYHFPEIRPEASISAGLRLIDLDGSEQAFEYEYLENSPVFWGAWRSFKYPHRLHLDVQVQSKYEHQGDVFYAYKDTVLVRMFNNTLFHNLDNIELIDMAPSSSVYQIIRNDSDETYGVRTWMDNLMLRIKTPDFPAHAYIKLYHVNKEGSYQQRSLLGSGYFQDIKRSTRERDIEWETNTFMTAANSHLGPVEAEFEHVEKWFEVKHGEVMIDTYTSTAFRPAGDFPHNQIPELKGSSNIIKIHTGYAERLTASATFKIRERENRTGGARSDTFGASGNVTWSPVTRLSLFMKYSHTELDTDNPNTSSIADTAGAVTTYGQTVKPAVSKTTDRIYIAGRYRAEKGVVLKVKYNYENINRDNAAEWNLEDSTRKSTVSFSGDLRMLRNLNFKGEYTHKIIDKPSYNTEPDYSDRVAASFTWIPVPWVSILTNYAVTMEERDNMSFTENVNARDRSVRSDTFLASGSFMILPELSTTVSYAFMRYKIRQDLVYDSLGGTPLVDSGVPMKDTAHVYSLSFNYSPTDRLDFFTGVSHARISGEFSPHSPNLTSPVSIASFSDQKIRETTYYLSGDYKWIKGLSGGMELRYNNFEDAINNTHDSNNDGDAYIIILKIKKIWG